MSNLGPYHLMSFNQGTRVHATHRWHWVAKLHSEWLARKLDTEIYVVQFPGRTQR